MNREREQDFFGAAERRRASWGTDGGQGADQTSPFNRAAKRSPDITRATATAAAIANAPSASSRTPRARSIIAATIKPWPPSPCL